MIQLVVFDLDGTLIDSHRDLADATNALLQDLGATPLDTDVVTSMVGEGAAVLVRRALTRAGLDPETPNALDRFLAHYDQRLLATTLPYPGMTDALGTLGRTKRLAVLTNKPVKASQRILEGLGLASAFADVIGGDTPFGRKPNPAGLLDLAARAKCSAAQTLLVGDSPVDLVTARNAATHICLARYGFGYRFEPGDFAGDELFIDSPHDLPAVLAELD
jgi:phosphoglycolate phosphatase